MININRLELFKYFVGNQFLSDFDDFDNLNDLDNHKQYGGSKPSKMKWTTLSHNGLKFPPEYVQKNIPLICNGMEIELSKNTEEYAFLYAKYIGTDYVLNNTFNRNFFNDWKKMFTPSEKQLIQSLQQCDFSLIKNHIEQEKINSKNNETVKEDDSRYKIAIVDGKEQAISNYKVEPPGIFIGRGKNPLMGKIKLRTNPEDVTINIGRDSTTPIPPAGHKWGRIIHDRHVEWLASWKDLITGKTKYLWLSAHSDQKSGNDLEKFELARKLKRKIKNITEKNEANMQPSKDVKLRQIATAMYFIDKLAIRVGNEKGEDSADTVGASNLRVEHIELGEGNKITLNFLGKDSVPYTNTIVVGDLIYNNVKEFLKGKEKGDQVFDKINSNDINKYLQEFMKDLTAKVYRTYNASNLFQKELAKITKKYTSDSDSNDTNIDKEKIKAILDDFNKANVRVAQMMNHQKNISTGYKKSVLKITDSIDKLKKMLAKARKSSSKGSKSKVDKIKNKIKNQRSKLELVMEMKNISLGTSKANYIDPRITVAFMKKHNLDINKIFSKTLQVKFKWAFDVDENFVF